MTIADVARESGVSAATVSLALRNKAGLREETRQRVLDAAQQLGYRYQASNQAATRQEVDQIGVLVKTRTNDSAATNS
ncbi:MAG: LacI family DNA-binding transcriptional regulator, partial [Candidatus Eremiobacteraeota bacterium]|nr:LacI family DNA-binding transcriptional regulator [Candidatus Eremiobacteraeota bacterium]